MTSPGHANVDEILDIQQQEQINAQAQQHEAGDDGPPDTAGTPTADDAPTDTEGGGGGGLKHDLNTGYRAALDNLVSAQARLNRLRMQLDEAEEHKAADEAYVAAYDRYVKKVKANDRDFPQFLSCACCGDNR